MTDEKKSLLPEDAIIPDEESRKMAEEVAQEQADKDKAEVPEKPEPEKVEEKKEPEKKEEPEDEDEDDSDESDDDSRETPSSVPAWQLQAFKKQMKRDIAELKDMILAANKPEATVAENDAVTEAVQDVDAKIKAFAEKNGWDLSVVQELKEALGTAPQIPPDVLAAAESIKQQNEVIKQETGFRNELKETLTEHPEFKGIDEDKLRELAFSKRFKKYRLSDIIRLNSDDLLPKDKPGMEHTRGGGARRTSEVDLTQELSAEQVASLSAEQFEEYSNNLAKRSKGTLMRNGRPVMEG